MSSGKCAYCEADYDATQPADVEHYRPKGGVDGGAGLKKPGYWWLAAAWHNLLPSCIRCNRLEKQTLFDGAELKTGKGNRFPLFDDGRRANAIGEEAFEDPLLIDPCSEDPSLYIKYVDDSGDCIAVPVDDDIRSRGAQRARVSIDIYGLNRSGLVRDRSRYLKRVKFSIARLSRFVRLLDRMADDEERETIADIIKDELEHLDGLTSGEDRYAGVLRG